jgi:hypothetical protein
MTQTQNIGRWQRVANFFESGDLVPVAVVVSSVHFVTALVVYGGESWPVAVLVGVFVDMLHYRTIRYAVRGRSRTAIILAALTTAMSYVFHLLFYIDGGAWEPVYLLLAAPLPFGIFILAWQQEQARAEAQQADATAAQTLADDHKKLQAAHKELQGDYKELQNINKAWQTLNDEAQALARFNAKQIKADEVADILGVKDVRTVQARAARLNGKVTQ